MTCLASKKTGIKTEGRELTKKHRDSVTALAETEIFAMCKPSFRLDLFHSLVDTATTVSYLELYSNKT